MSGMFLHPHLNLPLIRDLLLSSMGVCLNPFSCVLTLTAIAANILLTPFRIQNIPPPMSSCKVALTSRTTTLPKRIGTPIHASFSSASDMLAVLWESGYAELWSLHTRLQVGRGKVMDPSIVWSGQVDGGNARQYRQICVLGSDIVGTSTTLVVLSTDRGGDVLTILDLVDFKTTKDTNMLLLPHRNCRLVVEEQNITLQGPNGEIFQCRYPPLYGMLRLLKKYIR